MYPPTTTFTCVSSELLHLGIGFEKAQLKECEASAGPNPSLTIPPALFAHYQQTIWNEMQLQAATNTPLGCWVVSQVPLARWYCYLLVYFSGSHGHVAQVLSVTVTGVHATARRDAVLEEVRAGAPVGVALNATAAQLGGTRGRFKPHRQTKQN